MAVGRWTEKTARRELCVAAGGRKETCSFMEGPFFFLGDWE